MNFPTTRFVADFIGTSNFLTGVYRGEENGLKRVVIPGAEIWVESPQEIRVGEQVTVVIRPEKLSISKEPNDAEINSLQGVIEDIIYVGTDTRYFVRIPANDMVLQVFAQNVLHTAKQRFTWFDQVYVNWDPGSTSLIKE